MEKDRFFILTIIILFVLNLFTLGYLLLDRRPSPSDEDDIERVVPLNDNKDIRERKLPGRPDEIIIGRLKLNKEQILQFENLKKEHRKQTEDLQYVSKKLHDDYFGLLKSETPDTVRASQLLSDIAGNQQKLDKVTFEHFQKIKDICDKEQRVLFNTFIEDIAGSFKPPMPKK